MAWRRASVVVEGAAAEAVAEALEALGAVSTELADADAGTPDEDAIFAEPGADTGVWARCASAPGAAAWRMPISASKSVRSGSARKRLCAGRI